jgi:Transposase DDE domain
VFRERYAKRSGLESTNSGVKRRLGLGELRVRGRRAVDHAIYLKVAGWNLLRAAASGKLRSRIARALARFGAALDFCVVYVVWRLAYGRKWLTNADRFVHSVSIDLGN